MKGRSMITVGDDLRAQAERMGIPFRTLNDVRETLAADKKKGGGTDRVMARIMLRHGRLTNEARAWVAREYPGC